MRLAAASGGGGRYGTAASREPIHCTWRVGFQPKTLTTHACRLLVEVIADVGRPVVARFSDDIFRELSHRIDIGDALDMLARGLPKPDVKPDVNRRAEGEADVTSVSVKGAPCLPYNYLNARNKLHELVIAKTQLSVGEGMGMCLCQHCYVISL